MRLPGAVNNLVAKLELRLRLSGRNSLTQVLEVRPLLAPQYHIIFSSILDSLCLSRPDGIGTLR
jgi:hypothetical protein